MTKQAIQFKKHFVTNGTEKARVSYSRARLLNGRDCVTLYAKDYINKLHMIFSGPEYENNSDMYSDYMEKGLVRIYPDSPLWAAAVAAAERR